MTAGATVRLVDEAGAVHEHTLIPGEECPACTRLVPKEKIDSASGPVRDRISVAVPKGEEGVLDDLMIQVVEKYREAWPEDARSARDGVGLVLVGEKSWKFRVLHYALYAALTLDITPNEEGA